MQSKNIIKPILFATGFILLLFVISYVALPANSVTEGPFKKLDGVLGAPKGTIEYVTIGDSESNASISPMEIWNNYGYTGYNCGVPGQSLQDTYYLLKQLLVKQSPKVVLLETNAFYRDFRYSNALQDAVDEAAQNIFPIYKYHNFWKNFNLDTIKEAKPTMAHGGPREYKGFRYTVVTRPYTSGPYVHKTKKIETIGDQPLLYLNKIVDLCRENKIKLVLYSSPSPLCWTYEKHNAAAAFAKQNHLKYIDFNLHAENVGIDWSKDTRDKGNHLNYYGAKKVTDYMGTYLSEHAKLKDHRGQKKYASWDKMLQQYLKLSNES